MIDEDDISGEKNGFFKAYHIAVLKRLVDSDLEPMSAFTDDLKRLEYVHGLSYVHNMNAEMTDKMTKPYFKGKSAEIARQKRTEGNKAFQQKDYPKAVQLYSDAILRAPYFVNDGGLGGEPELAMSFANRSAALVHLNDPTRALVDIEQALALGNYPTDLRYKLEERRAKCLLALGRPVDDILSACESASKCFKESRLLSKDEQPVKRQEQFDREIQRLVEEALLNRSPSSVAVTRKHHQDNRELPQVINGTNPEYPSLSDTVKIEQSEACGRYGVAKSTISVGDVIAVERPYAFVMNPIKFKTHCHHCFRAFCFGVALPCYSCARISFCSEECRRQSTETYHKIECPLIDCLYDAGISITCWLALRMIAQSNLAFFVALKPVIGQPHLQVDLSEQEKKYLKVFDLVTHSGVRSKESFFHVTLMADFLLKCLKIANYFGEPQVGWEFSDALSEDEAWIGSLLLRHIQLLQFNAHELSELVMKTPDCIDDAKSFFIGAAVFPTVSLFNHSCEPGIVRYCKGTTMVVRAIKTIGAGEQINENYGAIFTQKKRDERRRMLKERYWFHCGCQACNEDWPVLGRMNNDVFRFRCACRKPIIVRVDALDTPFINCPSCGKSKNILRSLQSLQETEESFKRGAELMAEGQFDRALVECMETLNKLDAILCPPYRDYIQCQEGARRCMLTMGNKNFLNGLDN